MVIHLVQFGYMIRINIHEAKAHLSRYLERVAAGETIVVCKRNRPVAEIRPIPARRTTPRPIGLAHGRFAVPRSFFEPLPESELGAWEGPGH
jgi:prevent-host-death family protein